MFTPHIENPGVDDECGAFVCLNALPDSPWIEPSDVSEAVLWLSSENAKFITGVALPVDDEKGY